MTERNTYNERNIYSNSRHSDRARAITAKKKAKARTRRIVLGSIALALVAVTAAGFMIFGAMNAAKPASTAPTTAISTTSETPALASPHKAAQKPASQTTAQPASQTTAQPAAPQAAQPAVQTGSAEQPAPTQAQPQTQTQDRIDNINGERVYIDTKRPAPGGSGTPAHFYANGKTSYGFDWTYTCDNCNFLLRCDYNFNQQQYDFQFYGKTPGTSHVVLYYNTDDNVQVPVNLTVTVDDALNVTAG